MKKWLSLIMALAMLVCMTACGAKPDDTENGTTTTTSNQVVQQDTIQTFLNDPANNGFVGQYYDAPENIKLSAALYDGAGIGVFGTTNWTEQEKQDVLAAAGWDAFHNPPLKLIRSDVENLVKDKLGLSLSEIKTKFRVILAKRRTALAKSRSVLAKSMCILAKLSLTFFLLHVIM